MASSANQSGQVLRDEILAEARREREEAVRRAVGEAGLLVAKAREAAAAMREDRLVRARAEGARRAGLILATVAVETNRLRLAKVESVLESIREQAVQRLLKQEGFDYQGALVALGVEALSQMAGEAFVVKVSPADYGMHGERLAEAIFRGVGRPELRLAVSAEPGLGGGGLIIEDVRRQQVWDNGLASRLERMWPELRRQVAAQIGLVSTGGGKREAA